MKDFLGSPLEYLLFEYSQEFIGIADPELLQFLRVNRAGVALFGLSDETQLLSRNHQNSWRNTLIEAHHHLIREQLEVANYYSEEIQLVRADGNSFWGQMEIRPFQHGSSFLWLVRITDLEYTRFIERELKHGVQRYEAVFTYATIGIVLVDRQGQMVSVNQQAKHQFGYLEEELVGQSIELLVPEDVAHRHHLHRQEFYENPQVRAMGHGRDLYARRKDGSIFPAEISLSYFNQGQELYAVAYIIDITFKKEAERELLEQKKRIELLNAQLEQKVAARTQALMATLHQLEQSKDELAKALAAERELGELKSRFVSMASHEFRTPLSAVLTSASLLEKYTTNEQQDKRTKHIQRIKTSVIHLNDILEEFLSLGKLEEGKVGASYSFFDLPALISDLVASLQGVLKSGQVIRTEVSCVYPVYSDQSFVRKILLNLLSNAVKYSAENKKITIKADCEKKTVRIKIQDQGIGISTEDQKHLFERFFRAKNATNIPGTGLGLHIVGSYLTLLGGTIDVESHLEQGTTVTITLPHEDHSAY